MRLSRLAKAYGAVHSTDNKIEPFSGSTDFRLSGRLAPYNSYTVTKKETTMSIFCTECGCTVWTNMTDKSIKYLGLTEAVYCDACAND